MCQSYALCAVPTGRTAVLSRLALQVEVTDIAAGKSYYFAAECWLGAAQGERSAERLLLASAKDPWADMTAYRVTVFTSSRAGAGTTAALAVTLHGSKGPPTTSTAGGQGSDRASAVAANASSTPGTPRGSMASSGRCELKVAGSEDSRVTLVAGSSCSFTLPSMHSLGQLRQLLLEVDTSTASQVGVSDGNAQAFVQTMLSGCCQQAVWRWM